MLVKLNETVTTVSQYFDYNTNANVPRDDEPIRVIGFGTTSEGGNVSQVLLETDIDYVDNNSCKATWNQVDPKLHLCAGTVEGGKDACDSDSGSPLFLQDKQGRLTQVGIVGDGIGCARAGVPSLNTRVSTYASWIRDTICEVSSNPPASCAMTPWRNAALRQLGKWWATVPGQSASVAAVALVCLVVGLIRWNTKNRRRKGYQEVPTHV